MIRLVATASHMYAGRQLRPGDKFESDPLQSTEMIALGLARVDTDEEKQKPEQAEQKQPEPEQDSGRKTLRLKREGSRNRYLRRDLRVGDSE